MVKCCSLLCPGETEFLAQLQWGTRGWCDHQQAEAGIPQNVAIPHALSCSSELWSQDCDCLTGRAWLG